MREAAYPKAMRWKVRTPLTCEQRKRRELWIAATVVFGVCAVFLFAMGGKP